MSSNSAAWPAFHRTALVCGLCLLALAFAMEAKMAWYGARVDLGGGISAAKAWPADMPRVVDHGIPSPNPIHPRISFAVLAAFSILSAAGAERWKRPAAAHRPVRAASKTYFTPLLFFRPPPALA